MLRLAALLAPWLASSLLASAPLSQGKKDFDKVDPYTKNGPEIIEKAGYASLGPFRLGDDQTTDLVVKTLGVPMLWAESAHFKLGVSLAEYAIPNDKREQERIKAELERLATRLPDVKARTKKLDPWLRLHLFAQRLEETYAQFHERLGLEEREFPTAPPDPKKALPGPYMGQGRYLGMSSKFVVLLFDEKASLSRYASAYCGKPTEEPLRWYFKGSDSLLYGYATEFLRNDYANDSALSCAVVSGLVQNLALGLRGYGAELPLAVSEGLAHWFSRQVDERYHFFSGGAQQDVRVKDDWNWAPSVRTRVEHKVFPSTGDMLAWSDSAAVGWADHLILWSRWDYLMSREDLAAGSVLRLLKDPLPDGKPLAPEKLVERARAAIEKVVDGDLATFDKLWSEWVLTTYPAQ